MTARTAQLGMLHAIAAPNEDIFRQFAALPHMQVRCILMSHIMTPPPPPPETFLGGVSCQGKPNPWTITLQLNGVATKLLIDTGAEVTVISEHIHNSIGSPPLLPPTRSLKGPSNYTLPVTGCFSGCLKLGTQETCEEIYVVQGLHQQLIGRPAIEALGLIVRAGAIATHIPDPIDRFPKLFNGLGKLNSIQLRDDAQPFSLSVPRRVAIPLMRPVKEELKRMERLGVIVKVEEPTDWFQRQMSQILAGVQGAVCLMDDILVHGATQQEHDSRLQAVLQRIQALGMTLNCEKSATGSSS